MKHKPIKVAWDDLEDAFNNQNEELVYYLDLVTGQVALDGEGEEDQFVEDESHFENPPSAVPQPRRPDSTRLYVQAPDEELKLEWMEGFLDEAPEIAPALAAALREALNAEDPTEEIHELLRDKPQERARWFLYRSERLHELIDRWLEENAIAAIEPAPWK